MSTINSEFDIKIDILHALKDFLDAYDDPAEMVVTEAISNAIDVGAKSIEIIIGKDGENHNLISFHNDGPAMTREQFKDYHVIARSSKTKGKGIGFAGVGAKVYLAAWDETIIRTETSDGKISFASEMFVKDNVLKAIFRNPRKIKSGTLYEVRLRKRDYDYLEKSISSVIVDVFSPAMIKGLRITINNKKIEPWDPAIEIGKTGMVKVKSKEFPCRLIITEDDIPDKKCNIQFHVDGKIISTRKPAFLHDIKPIYQKRFHVYVDAMEISDQLNLNKTSFKQGSGLVIAPVFQEIDRMIFKILKKAGYAKDNNAPPTWETNKLTEFFEKLFKDPKYAFLNPEVRGGLGTQLTELSSSIGGTVAKSTGTGHPGQNRGGSGHNSGSNAGGSGVGGFGISWVDRPDRKDDGWLDPLTNRIAINMAHALYIKYENDVQARNQRVGTVLTSVLIKNAAEKKAMTPVEAFDLQSELLTLAKDAMW